MNVYRIIDANINRTNEGLRIVEDVARFIFNKETISTKIKNLRHILRKIIKDNYFTFLKNRNSILDWEKNKETFTKYDDINQLVISNFNRIQEALRSLEEAFRLINDLNSAKLISEIRFQSYTIQQNFFKPDIPEGIYCITDSNYCKRKIEDYVKEILDGGCKIIQYREKYKSIKEKYYEIEKIKKIIEKYKALLIINDHIDLALIFDADGFHIGQDDLPLSEARKMAPNKIIGVSTHSIEQALEAQKFGADYIGFGPIFKTQTKDYQPIGTKHLEELKSKINIPFFPIGGINLDNLKEITTYSIKRVCVVSDILRSENITERVKEYNKILFTILEDKYANS